MYLVAIVPALAATDSRYRRDCFEGVIDPFNVDGGEIDVFAAMAKAMVMLPHSKEIEFHADEEALLLIRRQGQEDPNERQIKGLAAYANGLGIEISADELLRRQTLPRVFPAPPPVLPPNGPLMYRGAPIVLQGGKTPLGQ